MIKICNLSKSFKKQRVLKNIDLNLPEKGMVSFVGPSGCGKTTLLNCVSGLLDFEGDIKIKNQNIKSLNDYDISLFRLKTIGFVFQDYKLFESQDIYSNIIFPFESICIDSIKHKRDKVVDLLRLVSLKKKLNTKINKLSGGEKQRVAIARAMINSPSILICDEPTGNLDSYNSNEIMGILKKISQNSLVIIVSHDIDLVASYSDIIYTMEDGAISNKKEMVNDTITKNLLIKTNQGRYKKVKIPLKFVLSHIIKKIKTKKYRSLISASMMGLGLMSFGLSISLSNLIGDNIKTAYTSVIQEDRIIVSKKGGNEPVTDLFSIEEKEALNIYLNYRDEILDYGIYYSFPFEEQFHTNEINMYKSFEKTTFEGLTMRSINEFRWLEFNEEIVYPHSYDKIKNNEVILGLTIDTIMDVCYQLRIKRTVESLSGYLAVQPIPIILYLENLNWDYSDNQVFDVVGFILTNTNCFYHTNHRWNKFVFEESMRFPTSENIYGVLDKPWIFRKIPYLQAKNDIGNMLENSLRKTDLQKYYFEVANENFYPLLAKEKTQFTNKKLMIFLNNLTGINPIYSEFFQKSDNRISNPIYGSYGGYLIYPTLMIMGFAKQVYFSSSISSLNDVVDLVSNYNLYANEEIKFPDGVLTGYYANTQQNNVIFDIYHENLLYGNRPTNYDEIVISSTMANNLFGRFDVIGEKLFLSHTIKENELQNNQILRDFKYVTLSISGVVNDFRNAIFHNEYWPIVYFQKHLNFSRISLDPNFLSFEVNDISSIQNVVKKLQLRFDGFDFFNPSEEINSGIDEVCDYLRIILLIFSTLTIVISILLLAISNYLYINENKKELGLLRCIGLTIFETEKFVYVYSFLMGLFAYVLGLIYLMVINIFLNSQIASLLHSPFNIRFDITAALLMLVLSIGISFVCCLFFNKKIRKISPLKALRG